MDEAIEGSDPLICFSRFRCVRSVISWGNFRCGKLRLRMRLSSAEAHLIEGGFEVEGADVVS